MPLEVEAPIPLPGSMEAIARLNQAGYRVVIASNQSGIARELFDMPTLNAIHQKMHNAAQQVGADIDAVFFCPHAAIDNCDCRKPKPGMFDEIAKLARAFGQDRLAIIGHDRDPPADVRAGQVQVALGEPQ